MRRVTNLLSIILLMIASACNSEQVTLSQDLPLSYSILSRSENSSLSLPAGSQILLNAHGGIEIENQIFTYNGDTWENGNEYHWTNSEETTNIIALYPTYSNNDYTQSNLYSTGELDDVLIAQMRCSEKEAILLQFEHLFSLFTVNIDETLLESIQNIQLAVPAKVNYISPQEGTFSLTEEPHIITRSNTGTDSYSFIVPPMEASILTLTFFMKDNSIHRLDLNPHTFFSGRKYECNVLKTDHRPGISNAEQLIAFSQLINESYKGNKYTLADFGEDINGEWVYSLLNDIELTTEDCDQLEPIGNHTDTPFQHTFDGKGHVISNIKFKAYNGYGGLFGKISETATIKNLNINYGSGPQKAGDYKSGGVGLIAGRSYGTISNCHVTDSELSNEECLYIGGIVGYTEGEIINCSVKNTTIESSNGSLGVIAGYLNNGIVLNSYSSNNTTLGKASHNGGICGFAQNVSITNCYIYSNQNVKGQIIGTGNTATVTYCYCDQSPIIYSYNKEDCNLNKNYKYNDHFITTATSTPVYQALNQWIDTQTTYTSSFIQWKADTTLPAEFITD